MNQRPLTADEMACVREVLTRLRDHFHEWRNYEGHELELIGFAFYEGCGGSEHCGRILAEAAPFALANELVLRHGFAWIMIGGGDHWEYAVSHANLESPICLHTLEDGQWNGADYDEPPCPGQTTYDSLDFIVSQTRRNTPP